MDTPSQEPPPRPGELTNIETPPTSTPRSLRISNALRKLRSLYDDSLPWESHPDWSLRREAWPVTLDYPFLNALTVAAKACKELMVSPWIMWKARPDPSALMPALCGIYLKRMRERKCVRLTLGVAEDVEARAANTMHAPRGDDGGKPLKRKRRPTDKALQWLSVSNIVDRVKSTERAPKRSRIEQDFQLVSCILPSLNPTQQYLASADKEREPYENQNHSPSRAPFSAGYDDGQFTFHGEHSAADQECARLLSSLANPATIERLREEQTQPSAPSALPAPPAAITASAMKPPPKTVRQRLEPLSINKAQGRDKDKIHDSITVAVPKDMQSPSLSPEPPTPDRNNRFETPQPGNDEMDRLHTQGRNLINQLTTLRTNLSEQCRNAQRGLDYQTTKVKRLQEKLMTAQKEQADLVRMSDKKAVDDAATLMNCIYHPISNMLTQHSTRLSSISTPEATEILAEGGKFLDAYKDRVQSLQKQIEGAMQSKKKVDDGMSTLEKELRLAKAKRGKFKEDLRKKKETLADITAAQQSAHS